MNKKDLSVSPIDTPTIDGMEMQFKLSSVNTQNTTTGVAIPPATTAQPPSSTTAAAVVTTTKTSIHVTALDGFVNVNSLFTMAIFIGFSLTVPSAATAGTKTECTASPETVRRLIVVEVVSFSCFLFSSLIAQSLKLSINLINSMDANDPHKADIDPDVLKYGLFASATGSVMGCLFLMLSIVDFIQASLSPLRGSTVLSLRCRYRRCQETSRFRGCGFQLLPLLLSRGAGSEIGHQLTE